MDQRLYFVVEIDSIGFVFESVSRAASFMADAVETNKQGRYSRRRSEITLTVASYTRLCEMFPEDYKEEDDADETTACTVPDQTES